MTKRLCYHETEAAWCSASPASECPTQELTAAIAPEQGRGQPVHPVGDPMRLCSEDSPSALEAGQQPGSGSAAPASTGSSRPRSCCWPQEQTTPLAAHLTLGTSWPAPAALRWVWAPGERGWPSSQDKSRTPGAALLRAGLCTHEVATQLVWLLCHTDTVTLDSAAPAETPTHLSSPSLGSRLRPQHTRRGTTRWPSVPTSRSRPTEPETGVLSPTFTVTLITEPQGGGS